MEGKHNKRIVPLARHLRKNMTPEECHLWYDFLRHYPDRFLRQKVVSSYILDFYCASVKLAIELDGSQHRTPIGIYKDNKRMLALSEYGIRVLRIPNRDIDTQFDYVCDYIDRTIQFLKENQLDHPLI